MTTIALRKEVERGLIRAKIDFDTWSNFVNEAVREKLNFLEEMKKGKKGGEN